MARAISTPENRGYLLAAIGFSILIVAVWMNLPHPTGDPIPTGPNDIPAQPTPLPGGIKPAPGPQPWDWPGESGKEWDPTYPPSPR